jgi:tripartite ATP-independent transporter DctP family solute receptor
MIKKKILATLLGLMILVPFVAGCSRGASNKEETSETNVTVSEPLTIRIGHVLAPNHPYQTSLVEFARLVDEKSKGTIKVDVFHSSQLGNERDMVEGLQLGTMEMALVSTAPLASFTKDFLVFDLPFIFKDTQTARSVVDSEIGTELLKGLDKQEIKGICYFENGFRNVTNSKLPIESPKDLNGMKIRTMENAVHMDSFTALGADPTPMAFGELFTALQQKTIDAQENPLAIIDTSKFYEVQEYLSITEHFYAPAPMLMGAKFYNGLTAEQQKIITESALEARDFERKLLDTTNEKLIVFLEEKGMKINYPDKTPFIKAVQSVYEKYTGTIPAELIKKVQAANE